MTSAIPYWLLFILSTVSVGYCIYQFFKYDDEKPLSKQAMAILTGILIFVAVAIIVLYSTLGGNALWWVTGKDISFWNKLLRVIPLMIFLLLQALAPFAYKYFMIAYLDTKDITVKSQFISLIVIVPVGIIVSIITGNNTWFYIISGIGITVAALFTLFKHIKSVGLANGILYTITSFILCAAALVTLLYFIVAFFSLILEILPALAIIIGICIIFGKSFGNAVMRRDDDGNYIANDGSKHSSQGNRDYHDAQSRNQRNNS